MEPSSRILEKLVAQEKHITESVPKEQPGKPQLPEGQRSRAESAMPPLALAEPPVDLDQLGNVSNDDPAEIRELASLFLTQADESLVEIEAAIQAESAPQVARLAHKLQGTGATCGMRAVVPCLRRLETQAKQGILTEAGKLHLQAKEGVAAIRNWLAIHYPAPSEATRPPTCGTAGTGSQSVASPPMRPTA